MMSRKSRRIDGLPLPNGTGDTSEHHVADTAGVGASETSWSTDLFCRETVVPNELRSLAGTHVCAWLRSLAEAL